MLFSYNGVRATHYWQLLSHAHGLEVASNALHFAIYVFTTLSACHWRMYNTYTENSTTKPFKQSFLANLSCYDRDVI